MNETLASQEWGERGQPPIVLLHGALGGASDWRSCAPALAADHHVIAFDLPGHGGSDDRGWDFTTWSERFWRAVQQKTALRPVLVGYSMGARLALVAATSAPQRSCGLVLFAGTMGIHDDTVRELRAEQDASWAQHVRVATTEASRRTLLEHWWSRPVFGALASHPSYAALLEDRAQRNLSSCATALVNLGTGRMVPPPMPVDIPAFFVAGARDEKYVAETARLAKWWPHSTEIVLAETGHALLVERTPQVTSLILNLMEETKRRTRSAPGTKDSVADGAEAWR